MGNTKSVQKPDQSEENKEFVDVLYQRMGDRWYAFSVVDEEVFIGAVPSDAIEVKNGVAATPKRLKAA